MSFARSPFLEIPSSQWIAANRSAFAIRDSFPVSDGHTLVVSRRLISTWWEATPDERADLLALVDEVKEALDEELNPDGYNVGFNAGEPAGQTIRHLQLRIPGLRYGSRFSRTENNPPDVARNMDRPRSDAFS